MKLWEMVGEGDHSLVAAVGVRSPQMAAYLLPHSGLHGIRPSDFLACMHIVYDVAARSHIEARANAWEWNAQIDGGMSRTRRLSESPQELHIGSHTEIHGRCGPPAPAQKWCHVMYELDPRLHDSY